MEYFWMGQHPMPAHWQWLLPKAIASLKIPTEKKATCSQCPSRLNHYTHKARCCTYRPQLANFLIGLALDSQFISAVKFKKLNQLGAFLPLASLDTPYMLEAQDSARLSSSENLLTCHYWQEHVGCTIHKFRNHVCSTFFCYATTGPDHEIWDFLKEYVMLLETNLSWWLLQEMGLDPLDFLSNLKELDQGATTNLNWDDQDLRKIWGSWFGKEEDFFLKCAELVLKNKDHLYDKAASFLDVDESGLKKYLEFRDYSADTYLPVPRQKIEECEKALLHCVSELEKMGRLNKNPFRLSPNASFRTKESEVLLHECYNEAHSFLILVDELGAEIDFQPLSKAEFMHLEWKLGGADQSGLDCDNAFSQNDAAFNFLWEGLIIRKFFVS